MLKNSPFYSEKTNNTKKDSKKFKFTKSLSELPFFMKKTKN